MWVFAERITFNPVEGVKWVNQEIFLRNCKIRHGCALLDIYIMHMLQIWHLHLESHSILPSRAKTCYAYFKHIYLDLIVFVYQDRGTSSNMMKVNFIFWWSWSFDLWNVVGLILTGIVSKMRMDEFFQFEMNYTTSLLSYFIRYVYVYWMELIMHVCFFYLKGWCRAWDCFTTRWPSGRAIVRILLEG